MSLPSHMNSSHTFAQVPRVNIERSKFDRTFAHKTTFDADLLIPFYVDEALPGDTFNFSAQLFARVLSPLVRPIMDNMIMTTFFFAVPYRILHTNFVKLMGEQDNPGDSIAFSTPVITVGAGSFTLLSIYDYMGLPILQALTGVDAPCSYLLRAYNAIWNRWFRDENMQNSVPTNVGDGPDNPADYVLKPRGKRFDYFTSCLTAPQKGAAVSIPLGTSAPVALSSTLGVNQTVRKVSDHTLFGATAALESNGAGANFTVTGVAAAVLDPNGTLIVDLTSATAATVNALRTAEQLQVYFERDMRGGTRYPEKVKSHFGVSNPDARMQWPEYLGGSVTPIGVNVVPQTSQTAGAAYQGNLAAFGTASGGGHGFTKSFTEHCAVIGLVCVTADLTYQYGLDRMWNRRVATDFYFPAFAHLGEQAVLRKEIFAYDVTANNNLVFGYQERFAELRYKNSLITGLLRSNAAGTLDVYHLAQSFGAAPVLGDTFIQSNTPLDRDITIPAQPHFVMDSHCSLTCVRPLPVYGVPQLGGRL